MLGYPDITIPQDRVIPGAPGIGHRARMQERTGWVRDITDIATTQATGTGSRATLV